MLGSTLCNRRPNQIVVFVLDQMLPRRCLYPGDFYDYRNSGASDVLVDNVPSSVEPDRLKLLLSLSLSCCHCHCLSASRLICLRWHCVLDQTSLVLSLLLEHQMLGSTLCHCRPNQMGWHCCPCPWPGAQLTEDGICISVWSVTVSHRIVCGQQMKYWVLKKQP